MRKGYLDISRRQDDHDLRKDNYDANKDFHLLFQIGDVGCGRKFLELKIDPAALISALSMGHHLPIEFEILDEIKMVGTIREHKTINLRDRGVKKMVVPQSAIDEGWQYVNGYDNHHHRYEKDGKHYYPCLFQRYVPEGDSTFDEEPALPWEDSEEAKARRAAGVNPVGKPMRQARRAAGVNPEGKPMRKKKTSK